MLSNSIWNKNFVLLCIANLMLFMSMQLLLPTLPLYIIDIGGSKQDVGYIMGAYTLGATLMRFIAGWLVDNYGRKKNIIIGLVLMLAITVLYSLFKTVSTVTIIRVMHGMTFGLVSTAIGTMVAEVLPPARMGEGIGYFGLASTLSMALAPMVGLWVYAFSGHTVLFIWVSILTGLTLFSGIAVRNPIDSEIKTEKQTTGAGWNGVLEKTAFLPASVSFFIALIYSSIIYFIALHAAELGIANIGAFFAITSLTMLIVRPISGKVADGEKSDWIIITGFITILTSLIFIAVLPNYFSLLIAGGIFGIGFSCLLPTLQAMAVRHAPPHRRGAATGTYFMAFDLGLGLGAVLWGFMAEKGGYSLMYLEAIIPLIIGAAIYLTAKSIRMRKV